MSIITIDELVEIKKTSDKTIGFVTGCFDMLHVGHVFYLEQCKNECDILIVGVGSDETVRTLKGASRPIIPEDNRMFLVDSLKTVDYTILNHEITEASIDFDKILKILEPDILFVIEDDLQIPLKRTYANQYNCALKILERTLPRKLKKMSTTETLQRIEDEKT
jgi:rfaE bifunctional protein nucleotidyltransferase chain/domain